MNFIDSIKASVDPVFVASSSATHFRNSAGDTVLSSTMPILTSYIFPAISEAIQQQLYNASDEERENLFMALNSKYEITDVLPPPNHDDQQVLVMAFGYMLLFVMGTCGNAVVLSKIYDVVKSRRSNFVDNTVIYIVVLCCVDFGVCLSLPMTVIDQILGFWMFGSIVCKIHAVLENFGKVFSALVLTAMSFDRYAGVCHPQRKILRSTFVAICILIGMIVYALFTLSPLLWNFTARELVLFEKETAPHKITRMRIEKCTMVNISSTVFTVFTGFLFFFCFVVPLFLVGYFYSQLWCKLRQHARQFKASQIPLMRISLLTLVMAFFYFICWAPFWFATVYAVYLERQGDQGGTVPPIFVYFMYFIHALPFTNSAVNWILYGLLNRQLQRKRTNECCSNSHNKPNITLIANGHTTMTNLQALKTFPSVNSMTRATTSSEYQYSNYHHQNHYNQLPSPQRPSCYIQHPLLNGETQHPQQFGKQMSNPSSVIEFSRFLYASSSTLVPSPHLNVETQTDLILHDSIELHYLSSLPYTRPVRSSRSMSSGGNNNRKTKTNMGIIFDYIQGNNNINYNNKKKKSVDCGYPATITDTTIFQKNGCAEDSEDVDLLLKIENDATFL